MENDLDHYTCTDPTCECRKRNAEPQKDSEPQKRPIPYETYLATLGLLTLAAQHRQVQEDLRRALYATLDAEIDRYGANDSCDEALYGLVGVKELLARLYLEVAPG